jgi:hypothetical protein
VSSLWSDDQSAEVVASCHRPFFPVFPLREAKPFRSSHARVLWRIFRVARRTTPGALPVHGAHARGCSCRGHGRASGSDVAHAEPASSRGSKLTKSEQSGPAREDARWSAAIGNKQRCSRRKSKCGKPPVGDSITVGGNATFHAIRTVSRFSMRSRQNEKRRSEAVFRLYPPGGKLA